MQTFSNAWATPFRVASLVGAALCGVSLVDSGRASCAWSDGFELPEGSLVEQSNAWTNSGSMRPVRVVAGQVRLEHGSGSRQDVSRALSLADPMAPWFLGLDLVVTGGHQTVYFAHARKGLTFGVRLFVTAPPPGSTGDFGLALGDGAAATAPWPEAQRFGTTNRVIASYSPGTGVASLWVNPSNAFQAPVHATGTVGRVYDQWSLRQADADSTAFIDNLAVCDALENVWGTPAGTNGSTTGGGTSGSLATTGGATGSSGGTTGSAPGHGGSTGATTGASVPMPPGATGGGATGGTSGGGDGTGGQPGSGTTGSGSSGASTGGPVGTGSGVTSGGSTQGGSGGDSGALGTIEKLDWILRVMRPKPGQRIRLMPHRGLKVVGTFQRTQLAARSLGVSVQVRVGPDHGHAVWDSAHAVRRVDKRGRVRFRATGAGKSADVPRGRDFDIWIRATSSGFERASTETGVVRVTAR